MKRGEWTFDVITDGQFKLDGGSMFGVVPRVMWEQHHEPDSQNRIDLSLRCLVARHGDRVILVDTGMGDRWNDKHRKIFAIERQDGQLVAELKALGLTPDDVTDVVLTHLHFDHCGGTIIEGAAGLEPLFAKARHWIQEKHWRWAHQPSERDQASFRVDDFHVLEERGQLELVSGPGEIMPGVRVTPVNGHTPGQQVVEFHTDHGVVAFVGDLLPLASQLRVPWIMGYDLNPLLTLEEKKQFLSRATEENYLLIFEHDPKVECCNVGFVESKFVAEGPYLLSER
jgi:glyoxylase-like metal-dependent hydrolase (beta-lactamase superfamily II)